MSTHNVTTTIDRHELQRRVDDGISVDGIRPLHIAIMSTQKTWHGGESQASLLANGLRYRGHRVSLLARAGSEFAKRMSQQGLEVFEFASRGRTPSALWRVRQHLTTLAPDVLHLNDPHAVLSGGVASLGLSIPARVASRRVDFTIRSSAKYRWLTDGVICISNSVVNRCREAGLPDDRLHLVHDGTDSTPSQGGNGEQIRRELSLSQDDTLLLTVASLTECKGHEFLLQALPVVLQSNPNTNLALAGAGELQPALTEMANKLGISSRVHFLGYRNDVPDLLEAADLVVQPSVQEGLCSSLIDAMFSQTPIVATTAGGIPDLLDNRPNAEAAWLVPPRDADALAAAICNAIAKPNARLSRAKAACDRAAQRFTANVMVDGTVSVYRSLLSAHAAQRTGEKSNEATQAGPAPTRSRMQPFKSSS